MKINNIDELFEAAKEGDTEKLKNIGESAAAGLNGEQKKKLDRAMSDPEFLKSVLSSPRAQELIKKFSGGGK